MTADNPYAATEFTTQVSSPADEMPTTLGGIGKRVFLAWEKLRLVYIGWMAMFTLGIAALAGITEPTYYGMLIFGGFVANLLYFAGPIIETYVRWLGYNKPWPRWFLFISGTLLTMLLALMSIAPYLLPNQN